MGFQALKPANSRLSLRVLRRRKRAKNQPRKCKLLKLIDYIIEERHYLASVEPPEVEASVSFALNNIQKNYPHFVALIDDTVVGWCDIIPFARPAYAHNGLLGMGIVAKHRGRGIGEKLIRTTLAKAQTLGLIRIELTVRENNHGALNLYKKVGFVEIGIKHKDLQRWHPKLNNLRAEISYSHC